jgi:hypothetical protein
MTFFITKLDLPEYVKFSVNTADNLINPSIRDAHVFDVLPLLGAAEEAALAAYKLLTPEGLAALLLITDTETPGYAAALATQKVHTLFTDTIRPLLVYESYRRFLLGHGVHITPTGAEVISGEKGEAISGQQRTELRNDAASKCAFYRARLAVALRTYRGTSASTCSRPASQPGHGGLNSSAV